MPSMPKPGARLLAIVALLGILLPTVVATAAPRTRVQTDKPNIVVVVTDDMRATDWRALPKTQKLLAGGTEFPNFLITTPVCCPSRSTILTGQYAHHHGVRINEGPNGGWHAFRDQGHEASNVATWLDEVGYRTALVGKYLNGYNRSRAKPPPGWDRWYALNTRGEDYAEFTLNENGTAVHYDRPTDYMTDVLRRRAVDVVESTPAKTPLFLYLAVKAPHVPATPAGRHRDEFKGAGVTRDDAFNEADISDKPAYMRDDPLSPKETNALDALERKRLASLLAADEAIVAVADALKAADRWDNTYVFVLSDNGYLMGLHRRVAKGVPYEEAIRVPMLAFGPGFTAGTNDPRLAATIDLAPTIADLAGVPAPEADGRSLLDNWQRDAVLIEGFGNADEGKGEGQVIGGPKPAPPYAALRTADRIYVEYKGGEKELYDLRDDPGQLENLAPPGEGADLDELERLHAWLDELRECQTDDCRAADTRQAGE